MPSTNPSQRGCQGGGRLFSHCARPLLLRLPSLVVPPLSHCASPILIRRPLLSCQHLYHRAMPLSPCSPSLIVPPLSRCAAPLLSCRPSLIAPLPLSSRHASLKLAGCYIAASLIVPLTPPQAHPRGMIWLGGGGCDEITRGAASSKKHGSCEYVVWTSLDLVQNLDSMSGHAVQMLYVLYELMYTNPHSNLTH
jgi:hypothetical protein